MPVDTSTKKYLEEVKKGKTRRFVMICKGVKILSMIVYKKGTVEKFKKQAKEEGKGQFYFGVVEGKGVNISFKMARSDGFDKPPGKDLILKSFLATEADMKFKPVYEIVEMLPTISDDEEDDEAAGDATPPAADPAEASSADLARKLAEGLKKLKPVLVKATAADPSRKDELAATMTQIVGEIKSQQFDAARTNMMAFGKLLQDILRQAASDSEAAPAAQDNAALAGKLAEGLKKLKPAVEQVIAALPDRKAELVATMTQIAGAIKSQQFDTARVDMVAFGKMLQELRQQATGSTASSADQAATTVAKDVLAVWRDAKDAVDDQLNTLVQQMRNSSHPYLQKIAEIGLSGVVEDSGGVVVKIQSALFDYNGSQGEAKQNSSAKLLEAVTAYRAFVRGSKVLAVLDANKLCGPLTICSTLLDALDQIQTEVSRQAA